MVLPEYPDKLIAAVAAMNENSVILTRTGMPVEMPWLENVCALVPVWYVENEAGKSIADVLFGDVSPSRKLSLTFPPSSWGYTGLLEFRMLNGEDV
jgi:beta-glucosidase